MTALKLLNNEINGKESKHIKEQNLHDEETPWVTGSDNKTMPRNKQPANSRRISGRRFSASEKQLFIKQSVSHVWSPSEYLNWA